MSGAPAPGQSAAPVQGNWIARLLRLASEPVERCELCGKLIPEKHEHLLEVERGEMVCACLGCAMLLGGQGEGRFRAVPPRGEKLDGFAMSESEWRALARLGRDDAVRPVLLLHGLHPDDLATRLGEAVAGLRSQGIEVSLTGLDHRRAILAVGGERQPGRHEAIESALYAAAPELDEVVIRAAAETAAPVAVAAG
jgi:hypothetical protein